MRSREGDPAGSQDPAAFKALLKPFHSRSAALKRPGTGTSWKTLPLPLIRRATIFLPHPLAIAPCKLDQFLEPAKRAFAKRVESEGRAISLLADFEIVEVSTDVGKKEIADLGSFKRGTEFPQNGVSGPSPPVGKGKRSPYCSRLAASFLSPKNP